MKGIKELIEIARFQGFINYLDFKKYVPEEIVDKDQIEDIIQMLGEMGIEVKKMKAEVIKIHSKKVMKRIK